MAINGMCTITTTESSKAYLEKKIDWILDLMDKEHKHCDTHSQRNMYQAVIRHELELIRDELRYAILPGEKQDSQGLKLPVQYDGIPF